MVFIQFINRSLIQILLAVIAAGLAVGVALEDDRNIRV
jgi:hypothetical protein